MKGDLSLSLKLLGSLIHKQMPIIDSLEQTARACRKTSLANAWLQAGKRIRRGATLSEALQPDSNRFPAGFITLLEAAERTGNLASILISEGMIQESLAGIQDSIRRSLGHCLSALFAAVAFGFLWMFRIQPQLAQSCMMLEIEKPWHLSPFLAIIWLLPSVAMLILLIWFASTARIPPLFHNLRRLIWLTGWINRLAVFLKANVPLHTAMRHLESSVFDEMASELEGGTSLQNALNHHQEIPQSVKRMLTNGEKSGRLIDLLDLASKYYNRAARTQIRLTANRIAIGVFILTGLIIGVAVTSGYYSYYALMHAAAQAVP